MKPDPSLSPATRAAVAELARDRATLFVLSRPALAGFRAGLCRRVVFGSRSIRALVVQLAGGDPFARTRSARYRGPKVRLEGRELEGVKLVVRGRVLTLDQLLELGRSIS